MYVTQWGLDLADTHLRELRDSGKALTKELGTEFCDMAWDQLARANSTKQNIEVMLGCKDVHIIELLDEKPDRAVLGSTVSVRDNCGDEMKFHLLGPYEATYGHLTDAISYECEMAICLMKGGGRKVGDTYTCRGFTYVVTKIEAWMPPQCPNPD